ncbi:D-alanyl-D-alanine carboxypeptidase family protein, partial [Phocaeicola dorei]
RLLPNGLTTEFDEKKESDKDKDAGKKEEAKSSDKKEKKNPSEEERDQEIWLKDNAYKFGFIIRYPKQKED